MALQVRVDGTTKTTKQNIRIANDQGSIIGLSVSFYKSEATGHVQERVMVWRESDAGKPLDFSFVSNRVPCLSAQTPSQGITAVSLAHRACSDMYKRVWHSPWQPAPPSCRLQHFPSATDFQTFQCSQLTLCKLSNFLCINVISRMDIIIVPTSLGCHDD